jgi:hypothetical protein
MPITSFPFPFPSAFGSGFSFVPAGTSLLASLGATPAGDLVGHGDQLINPVTLDYVRTENGEWAQTYDSRTIVLIALSTRVSESPFDPDHGTNIGQLQETGDLVSPEMIQSETIRIGTDLTDEGVISDLLVRVRDDKGKPLTNEAGAQIVETSWRDLASGSPINSTFQVG